MSGPAGGHTHAHEHDGDNSFDWFGALDIAVWAAVAVLVALGVEWLIGYLVRERIARGADKFLATQPAAAPGTE